MQIQKENQANNFTLLRLLLALAVVLGHYKTLPGNAYTPIFTFADLAVDMFFIISGYLITWSWDKNPEPKGYFIRRFFRIYPLYLFIILAQTAAMLAALYQKTGDVSLIQPGNLLRYLGANLVFANFLARDIGDLFGHMHVPGVNASLWTLKIEVGFYLVLPLIWAAFKRWGLGVFAAIFVLSSLYYMGMEHLHKETLAKQLPGLLRFFVVGMAFYAYQHKVKLGQLQSTLLAAATFTLLYLCRYQDWFFVFYPLCVGLFVFLFTLRLPALPLSFDISYGVYLLHAPLIQFAQLYGLLSDTTGFLLMLLAAVITLALLAERWIERPGIEWGKKICRQLKAGA